MKAAESKDNKALASLVIINNDRYEGYKTAADETNEADLKKLFAEYSLQSKGFSQELRRLIPFKDEAPDRDATTFSGKFYRAWMDVKAALTGHSRKSILASCEYGEDVALKTYDAVLDNPDEVSSELLTLLRAQRSELQKAHDKIKMMRDSA